MILIASGGVRRYISASRAPVAQLDRVTGFEPVGREFESLQARQILSVLAYL